MEVDAESSSFRTTASKPQVCPEDSVDEAVGDESVFALVPDAGGSHRHCIDLKEGLNEVGRSRASGIRDHHISRRHVQVVVPPREDGQEPEETGSCRIRYVGRNCRLVTVGGELLHYQQEVEACAGTSVILNFNAKGNPMYSYTLQKVDRAWATRLRHGDTGRRRNAAGWCSGRSVKGFRKEHQEKLKKEREEIFRKFEDLRF
ncbi:unnamed protein product [Choristocarpus tenellus]